MKYTTYRLRKEMAVCRFKMFIIYKFLHKIIEPPPHSMRLIHSVLSFLLDKFMYLCRLYQYKKACMCIVNRIVKKKLVDSNSIAHKSYVRVKPFSCCFLFAMSPSFFQFKPRHILTYSILYIHTKNVYDHLLLLLCML